MKKLKEIVKKAKSGIKKVFISIARNGDLIGYAISGLIFFSLMLVTLILDISWSKYEIAGLILLLALYDVTGFTRSLAERFEEEKEEPVLQIVIKNNTKGE